MCVFFTLLPFNFLNSKYLIYFSYQKVRKNDVNKNTFKDALLHWQKYDIPDSKEPTEANAYVCPQYYLECFHLIQVEMNKKQFIQENVPKKLLFLVMFIET